MQLGLCVEYGLGIGEALATSSGRKFRASNRWSSVSVALYTDTSPEHRHAKGEGMPKLFEEASFEGQGGLARGHSAPVRGLREPV